MKVRQVEVHLQKHLGQLEEFMRNEGLLRARLEGAGWLPLHRVLVFEQLLFFCAHS